MNYETRSKLNRLAYAAKLRLSIANIGFLVGSLAVALCAPAYGVVSYLAG